MTRPRRSGFTLAETLVVVVILALLVGLLLPAVGKLREASNRLACGDHLRHLGHAAQGYHAARGTFPTAGKSGCDPPAHPDIASACRHDPAHPNRTAPYTPPTADLADRRREWGWAYHLLPHLGYADTYAAESDAAVRRGVVKELYCPSRRPAGLYGGWAKTDYAGNAGGSTSDGGASGVMVRTGAGPAVRLCDLSDGAANTVLFGEKRMRLDRLGTSRDDDESAYTAGWDADTVRAAVPDADTDNHRGHRSYGPSPDLRSTPADLFPDPDAGLRQFGASHPAGCQFVMCDGGVRTVRYHPDRTLFRRLCVRDDGPAPPGDF